MRSHGRGDTHSIEDLLPHRPPALLVTEVIEHSAKSALVGGRIPRSHPCVGGEQVSAPLVVDFAAQAAGVLIALSRTAEIEDHPHPEPGFLVSLRETELLVPELPVDQSLEARVQLVAQMGNLSTFSFTVSLGGVPAAEGRLSLAIPRQSR